MGTRRNTAIAEQHPTGLIAPLGRRVWDTVYKIEAHTKQRNRCAYCREPTSSHAATADHVTPRSRGGLTSAANIKSACKPCNSVKGSMTEQRFKKLIRAPEYPCSLGIWLAHIRYRIWTREMLAEKRILGVVGLRP